MPGSLPRIPPSPVTDPDVDPFPDGTPVPTYDSNGNLLAERYYRDGVLHREDGPAVTTYLNLDHPYEQEWHVDGKLHRLDGPARVEYGFGHGGPSVEQWYVDGRVHRLDGPAWVEHHEDGSKNIEHYYREGELHRIDGPATLFHANGQIYESFYFHGLEENGYVGLSRALSWQSPELIEPEIRSSSFGPLLDEGVTTADIGRALFEGIHTVDGIRALHSGAPAEWVRSFESSVNG